MIKIGGWIRIWVLVSTVSGLSMCVLGYFSMPDYSRTNVYVKQYNEKFMTLGAESFSECKVLERTEYEKYLACILGKADPAWLEAPEMKRLKGLIDQENDVIDKMVFEGQIKYSFTLFVFWISFVASLYALGVAVKWIKTGFETE